MNKRTILYAFIVVCVLYFFSSLLHLDSLEIIVKPLFLPILFIYYLKKNRGKYQIFVVLSFVFYYISEVLFLLSSTINFLYGIFFNLISYLILLYIIGIDFLKILKFKKHIENLLVVLFMLTFLIYLFVSIILLIDFNSGAEKMLLYFYGITLILLCSISIASYMLKYSSLNLFLMLMTILFIVSDVFYLLIIKIEYNWVFKSVNLIAQLLSYYFFVVYSLIKSKK